MPDSPIDPAATDDTSEPARNGASKRRDPSEPTAVVGLGASAGGVAVLQQFFTDMSPDSGLAFVVVMHLSPEFESQLANVIQQRTTMPVSQVMGPMKVRRNHVYVIPPNHQLKFEDSTLHLIEPQQALGRRVTIDLFFRTLAQAYGHRAVCVILSGTDSDGVIGLKHIRAQGGLTIVQDPNEAEHDSMPATAIGTGMVDWVLPVAQMTPKLMEFVRNESRMKLPPEIPHAEKPGAKVADAPGGETIAEETYDPDDEFALEEVLKDLRTKTGHDFTHYKRATILRRVARRLQVNSLENIPQYLDFLRAHAAEGRALLQDLLIGVTHFFRDRDAFASLEAHIPQLFAGKKKDDTVRVWVAGCATGEEAYSIAILLCEHAARLEHPPAIQLFGSDVDEQAIAEARDGLYPSMIEADVSPERLRDFFMRDHGRYRVRPEIREKILFASHDVLKDAPFSRVDLISCRNLLIYLNGKAQEQVFDIFHFSLRPGGLLFIGGSENHSQAQALFSPVDAKNRLFVRRSTPRPSWKVPILPVRAPGRPPRSAKLPTLPALTQSGAEKATDRLEPHHLGQTRREALFGELHLRLLEQYGPPSVVVNETHEIVHLSENAGRYLQFAAGEPTANVVKVVHPALQIELRTALFKAAQTRESVKATPQRVDLDGTSEVITLDVCPMRAGDAAQGFYLVRFEKESEAAAAVSAPSSASVSNREVDAEIQFLKGQLSATVEQYEGATEELKASNEELQAMNEEMRSATEELETSKEELQSVNEELTTVNHELKSNVEELSHTNADLNNLMASTDIGTLFLDRQLRIQRFTPSAQKIFNLIPADMGRPIGDITSKLHYEGFIADAETVLRDLRTIEREVRVGEQNWFLTRVAPYRTGDDRIAGVVATFIDITPRKQAEDELRESEARVRRALEIETVGVMFFTMDGRVADANNAFLKMSGYARDDLAKGALRWDQMTPPVYMERSLHAIDEFKRTGKTSTYEKEYIRKDGSRWWGLFSATKLSDDLGVEYVLDISDRKAAEDALRASEERFRQFAENSADVFWIIDAETQRLEYLNPVYEQMWGEPRETLMRNSSHWLELVHPDDRARAEQAMPRALAGETFILEYRIVRRADGDIRWIRDTIFPIRNSLGRITRVAGVAQDVTNDRGASEALRVTEERFRLLVEGTPDYAMFLLDPANKIIFWSSGAERVFGWTAEEAVGQTGALIFTSEDRAEGVVEEEINIARDKSYAPDRRWHLRKDGSRFWVDGVMRRLDAQDGSLRGFAKIARDATEQRRFEDALHDERSSLEQRVLERTAELMASNTELQNEIRTRQQLERDLLMITERERRRMSEDLHDVVCQELTATALFLKSSGNKAGDEETARILNEAAEIVNHNVVVARDLARAFQPAIVGSGGLTAALRALCAQANAAEHVSCRLKLPRAIRLKDETLALNLYRIAQEAVANAVKHSDASDILVCMERENSTLRLVVEDNGKGFRPRKRGKGLGLHIMKHRASVLGGQIRITTPRKGGTKIVTEVPLKKTET